MKEVKSENVLRPPFGAVASGPVMSRKLRVYADTSVFGGCFDEEFRRESNRFFDEIKAGKFTLAVSAVVLRELADAPENVRAILASLPPDNVELLPDGPEIVELREAYLRAGVVSRGSEEDAEHVAAASVAEVDMVVSWNFRHIVHFEKIDGYRGVNLLHGYKPLDIYSPREVIEP